MFETAAQSIHARGEGLFVPLYAISGTGKTTLANSLRSFFPGNFTPTAAHLGEVTFEALKETAQEVRRNSAANEDKIIPINVDHRESDPASSTELAAIKRFLREPTVGKRALILWPETTESVAAAMSRDYEAIAGRSSIPLPAHVEGPVRDTWTSIANHTLQLSNDVDSLELMGVDPKDYDPAEFRSIGEYLRQISDDFTQQRLRLLRATRKPIRLAVVIVSSSENAGVLMHLTNSSKFGLLDSNALLDATKASVVGRWWREHRGLLTQMIVQLDARVFGMPPAVSIPVLRRFGPADVQRDLETLGVRDHGATSISKALRRSDFGKYLNGTVTPTYETRGTPSAVSLPAFQLLGERGFTAGKDKELNKAVLEGIKSFLDEDKVEASAFAAETSLGFVPLIPDNSFTVGDDCVCVEYTWRKGEFLANGKRGDIAAYILQKLQNYARELGYVAE
ncbi:hypothetical protein ABZ357_24625 [Streptomyces sp. NPDC005917]|uniref:hypothetical protein n=1 Tax=unclassified Streptomyces TaxID=2593676 RepID=UPI0033C85151